MEPWASVAQARDLDRRALQELGLPGLVLMESAGAQAAAAILAWWRNEHGAEAAAPRVVVVCGSGNNGGDGYVVARRFAARGVALLVLHLHAEQDLSADALTMRRAALGCGVASTASADEAGRFAPDLVVDAVLGTGARRPVEGRAAQLLRWVHGQAARASIVALDLPSGLDGDTGEADVLTPRCGLTVTFGLAKTALREGPGRDLCGSLVVADLGLPLAFRLGSCNGD